MDSDMKEDLEKYKKLYKQTKKDAAKARAAGVSDEEMEVFRKKLFDLLFKIEVLEEGIENANNIGGKIK